MMATEPTVEQSVEASATSNAEPTTKIDLESQDGVIDHSQLNGDTPPHTVDKLVNDIVDEVVNSAEVSISGGSDTEASRLDKSRPGDEKGHGKSTANKKPATFKSVSVNRTFLATKGTTSNAPPSKVGDKSATLSVSTATQAPTAASAARPRLVAKSGSGLRDSSKSTLAANGRPAPSASAVWNKNRPAPPPEPKNLTDEDLSKLGIHLATRFQPDDAKGQSNWADIDEDEEDWAPETIAWADGTKTTIPHADEAAAAAPEPPVEPTPAAQPAAKEIKPAERPRSPVPRTGSPAIKPGVLASGKGLILKGAPEKPTLVAKPPAPPTPVKSPWAALPPIDKASPVVTTVPSSQSQRAFPPPGQVHGLKGPTPPPAKEIAADDFSRSPWRDGPGHNRELFNSQSGRYEPVTDRRGLAKSEIHPRQPAVLQRPNHSDHQGPAEPSSAFQTSHTSGNYSRRRGSSNVSGGSGSFLQRMGKPHDHGLPPPEVLNARRGSIAAGSEISEGGRNFSPSGLQGGPRHQAASPWQHRVSPAITHATPQLPLGADINMAPPVAPQQTVLEDDYEYQKQLMKERRELAMKRRLEEEAREEAAKKERLRRKLESLGPAPERKSEKKDVASEAPAASAEQISQPSHSPIEGKDNKPTPKHTVAVLSKTDGDKVSAELPNGFNQTQSQPRSSSENISATENKPNRSWEERASVQQERVSTQPDHIWGGGNQPSVRNVWGSPNNNRSLGNGTFNSVADTRPSQLPEMQGSLSVPGPIGPPKTTAAAGKPAAPQASTSRLAPIGPPQSNSRYTAPAQRPPPQDAREIKRSAWANAVVDNDNALLAERRQQQAQHERELKARGLHHADVQGKISDQWQATGLDERGQRIVGETAKVLHAPVTTPSPAATWSSRSDDKAQQVTSQRPAAANVAGQDGIVPTVSQTGRGSRFFPPNRDVRHEEPVAPQIGRSHSPSPPPPDMAGHPAFDGDAAHPHVVLPAPVPVVRLPPAQSSVARFAESAPPRSGPSSFAWATPSPFKDPGSTHAHPSRPAGGNQGIPPTSTSRPSSQQQSAGESWQNKFDNLLSGRKASPPKPMAVDSSSRGALAPSMQPVPATVSLPGMPGGVNVTFATVDDGSFATNRVMDEDCFEEQEMGSLPPVHIPKDVPPAAYYPAKIAPRLQRSMIVVSTSAEATVFDQDHSGANKLFHIHFPGDPTRKKTVSVSSFQQRSGSNPRRGRGGNARFSSSSHRGGNRNRDSSASYSADPAGPSANRGGNRGGYRSRSDNNWSRNGSAPVQT